LELLCVPYSKCKYNKLFLLCTSPQNHSNTSIFKFVLKFPFLFLTDRLDKYCMVFH
jgi:hypothetical protein